MSCIYDSSVTFIQCFPTNLLRPLPTGFSTTMVELFALHIIDFTTIPMNFIHIIMLLVLCTYMLFYAVLFYHVYVFDDTGQ